MTSRSKAGMCAHERGGWKGTPDSRNSQSKGSEVGRQRGARKRHKQLSIWRMKWELLSWEMKWHLPSAEASNPRRMVRLHPKGVRSRGWAYASCDMIRVTGTHFWKSVCNCLQLHNQHPCMLRPHLCPQEQSPVLWVSTLPWRWLPPTT